MRKDTMSSNKPRASVTELAIENPAAPSSTLSTKSDLRGIAYSRETFQQFYGAICQWLRGDHAKGAIIGYVNPHVFNVAMKHEAVRTFLDKADIVAVDGVGFALALLLLKGERQTRTVMTPLFDRVLETDDLPRRSAVLIGGTEEMARKGAADINRVGRKMQVVAYAHGYQPLARYHDFLREHEAVDLVLVALGSPRSEEFIVEASSLFPGKLFWNIGGGTLQYHAGTLRQVPKIVSTLCLQWLWRMFFEPHLVPRYVIGIPAFIGYLLKSERSHKMKVVSL